MAEKIEITKVRLFTKDYFYNKNALIKVNNKVVSDLGGTRSWVRIKNGNKTIYRIVSGSGDINLDADTIELDNDSYCDLGISDLSKQYNITLQKAGIAGRIFANIVHPDTKYSIPLFISLISLFLGIVSIILAFTLT